MTTVDEPIRDLACGMTQRAKFRDTSVRFRFLNAERFDTILPYDSAFIGRLRGDASGLDGIIHPYLVGHLGDLHGEPKET